MYIFTAGTGILLEQKIILTGQWDSPRKFAKYSKNQVQIENLPGEKVQFYS
jgi:hypothetical protein